MLYVIMVIIVCIPKKSVNQLILFFLNCSSTLTDEGTGPPGSTPPPHSSDGHHKHHQMPSHILLSELPEPLEPLVSEIGPIPPPPMFSTPSPTMMTGRQQHGPILPSYSAAQQQLQQQQQVSVVQFNRLELCSISTFLLPQQQQHQHMLQQQMNYNDYDYDGK